MNIQSVKQRFGIIGTSEKIDRALSTAIRVSSTDLTVLITGESGSGKEVFSKIIHSLSARKHNKFIAINTGAIPSGTINSELFGHEKGAFTGATADRKGYFETVDGGTIFLDEIGEMPMDTQAYLLRILESGEFMRMGTSTVQKTDVRIIAATNVDLKKKIRDGKFREDLYYRLNTVPIVVPSLKERREDIHLLFRKFASDFAENYRTTPIRLDEHAQLLLENYSWPGNVRELKNLAEQISVLSEEKNIGAEELLELNPNLTQRNLPALSNSGGSSLEERDLLYKVLFDMKKDLNDLKALVYGLAQNNDLSMPEIAQLRSLQPSLQPDLNYNFKENVAVGGRMDDSIIYPKENGDQPVILSKQQEQYYDKMEVVEESLSLEEMEKEMISKALKKYKGRRKDAAGELGISERTLYRKIKYYNL